MAWQNFTLQSNSGNSVYLISDPDIGSGIYYQRGSIINAPQKSHQPVPRLMASL